MKTIADKLDSKYYVDCTISENTLLTDDLIIAIEMFLKGQGYEFEPCGDENKQDYLNEYLWSYMNAIAPDGTVFSCHAGNGSDIGFWRYDNEDL